MKLNGEIIERFFDIKYVNRKRGWMQFEIFFDNKKISDFMTISPLAPHSLTGIMNCVVSEMENMP